MQETRKCGVLLHPTSFPSKYGIGDLGTSACKFIDFLEKGGQKLWQTLPLGPTSFGDSPYQSFSAFAGNFYLISLDCLLDDGLLEPADTEDKPDFNSKKVDYGPAINYKTKLLKKAFKNFDTKNRKFKSFCSENSFWLDDYALFSALKEHFIDLRQYEYESAEFLEFSEKTKKFLSPNVQKDYYYGGVWYTWPKGLIKRDPKMIKEYQKLLSENILYFKFLQYIFSLQWTKLKSYANSKGIEIIGDIPIFIAYDSADVWAFQELFQLDSEGFPTVVAGVPPDYFSPTGQLWGNPLYDWKEHEKTEYKWWVGRVKTLLKTCDYLRIDHFRGFESNYAIPFGSVDATKGKWLKGPGKKLFDAIKKETGHLPIIAEDLGIITSKVTKLRESLGFPGMKILQFAFDGDPKNAYLPHNFEKNCVVYTGTHDNDTSFGWYGASNDETRDYFRRYMNTDGRSPSWDLIRLAIASCADIAIYPLQDILCLPSEARMNTPGTNEGNWSFRYSDDDLLESYAETLKYLTKIFGR